LAVLLPVGAFGQNLVINNYQLVEERRLFGTQYLQTLRADLVNPGAARSVVVATVSSNVLNLRVIDGRRNLHFLPVPANSQVTSLDTFQLIVDKNVPTDYSVLQWNFSAPYANAGPNQTVPIGRTVILDASGSTNPSGAGFLTYNWTFLSRPPGSSAIIRNATDVRAEFVVDVSGSWTVQLTVNNGVSTDTAIVIISTGNSPPIADAGPNRTVAQGATVQLNGTGSSDADGDPLTYLWTITSKPAGSNAALSSAAAVSPTFIADRLGTYTVQLVVSDPGSASNPATVIITTQNTAPVPNAGPNQAVSVGATVQLTGAGSTDVDGDPLTYQWILNSVPSGSPATLINPTSVNPTFVADRAGTFVAQLIVSDGKVNSTPATVTISTGTAQAPTANAGVNQTVKHHSLVQLTGSGTDPQSRPLTYQWSLTTKPAGSTAVLSNATLSNPTFTADLPGNYVAQLIVNNGTQNSPPSTVTITTFNTAPVADAGLNQTAPVGALVSLSGAGSSDADGDAITYSWTFTSRPAGSSASLSAANSSTPTFIADVAGIYVVQLIVSDQFTASNPSTVTINTDGSSLSLTPDPLNLLMNAPGTLTVALGAPAPAGGQVVNLASLVPTVATVPSTVTVPPNSTSATFTVTPTGQGVTRISASIPGFRPGLATVNVTTPSLSVAFSAQTVGLTRTVNGTVTLSAPAPPGGISVSLAALPAGIVSIQGAPVSIAAGATTGAFTVTGVAVGSTSITASSPGYSSGAASITASLVGLISVQRNITLTPGQTVPIQVTLATAAPIGGVTVTLTSSDTSKVTVLPSITIPAGATEPVTPATVTGVGFGVANISASAPGLTGDTAPVTVASSLTFAPTALTLGTGGTQNFTLSLSTAAPSTVTITLISSNNAVATVPSSVTIVQGATSVPVPVTGGVPGSATITATPSGAGVLPASAGVTVTSFGSVVMPPNATVNLGQSTSVQVSLTSNAPAGGVVVTLSSSDQSKVTLSSTSVTIPAGSTTPAVQPTLFGAGPGTAIIGASAPGFLSASQAVTVVGAFTLTPPAINLPSGSTQNLTLTLSGPAPTGGLTANVESNNTAATVPPTVSFAAGATTVLIPVTGVSPGSAVIRASAPSVTQATANVNVQNSGAIGVSSASLSPGQSTPLTITLPSATPNNLTVALVSSDTSKATVSQASITILAGQTQPLVQPQVSAVNFGSAVINASAVGYTAGTGTVQVGAALNFLSGPITIAAGANQSVTIALSVPAPAGGVPLTLTSSNPGVATVPPTATIIQNSGGVQFLISGLAPGTTTITATAGVANVPPVTLSVTVTGVGGGGSIGLPSGTILSVGQTSAFPVTLSTPAPAGNLLVTLSSSDASKVTISPLTVTVLAGQLQPASQPTVTGVSVGSAIISAAAPGYTGASQTVQVNAPGALSLTPATLSISIGSSQNLTVTLPAAAGTGGVSVSLSSSNTGVVTVPTPVIVPQGATSAPVPVTAIAIGNSTITANAAGLTQATANITVTNGNQIVLPVNFAVAPGETKTFPVTLASPALSPTTVSLTSSNPSNLTFTQSSLFFNTGQTTPSISTSVTGVSAGTVTVSAAGSGLANASTSVRVGYTIAFNPAAITISGTATQNLTLVLSGPAQAGGLTVNLSSSATGVATVPATVTFTTGATTASVPVTGVAPGAAVITASAVNIPVASGNVTVVAVSSILVPALTNVAIDKSVPFPISLSTPAGFGGVTVTLTSANPGRATVPATVFIAQGQTQPAAQPQVSGINVGGVNITASAPGYSSGTGVVQVSTTVTWQQPNLNLTVGQNQVVFFVLGASAPWAGLTVNFTSSNPAVATVRESIDIYPDGSEFTTVALSVSAHAPGVAVITASGTNIPATSMTVTVGGPLAITTTSFANGTVGVPYSQSLQAVGGNGARTWSLTGGTLPSGLSLNAASGVLSGTPTSSAAFTPLTFRVTDSSSPVQTATATLNLTIIGSGGGGGTMTLTPSPLAVTGTATQNLTLTLSTGAPAGGLTVNVSSSNTGAATAPSSVIVPQNTTSITIPITGVAAGATTVTATATGFGQATAAVNVSNSGGQGDFLLPQGMIVAPGDNVQFPVTLARAATQPTFVSLTSSDPSILSLSTQNLFFNTGQTTPTSQPRINGNAAGQSIITVTSFGLATATATVRVGLGVSFVPASITITGATTQNLTLTLTSAAIGNLTVNLASSNTGVATVPSTVTFSSGSASVSVPVTGVAPGNAVITASGATFPSTTASVTVVSPGLINLPPLNVALGQTIPLQISVSSPAPAGGLILNLNSSDTSKLTVPATVVIAAGQMAPASQPNAVGVNVGNATVTATAPGYTSATAAASVSATVTWTTANPVIVQGQQQILLLRLSASAPLAGLGVTLSSSNPAVAGVQSSVNFFPDGSEFTTVGVNVSGLSPGTSIIQASGTNIPASSITVTVVGPLTITTTSLPSGTVLTPYSRTLAATGGQTPYSWTLISGALPAGLSLNALSGLITGTPTTSVANTPLTFRVTDSSAPQQTTTVSLTLTIGLQVPASITATGGGGQTTPVGTAFTNPLVVLVKDADGLPVSGVTVTFSAPGSGPSGTFAGGAVTAVTNASGVATSAVFTANSTTGAYNVIASVAGLATSASFALTNTQGSPATITTTSGTPQNAQINQTFGSPLVVTVRDAFNNLLSGITVTFVAPASGASGSFAGGTNSAVTTAAGVATSAAFTANATTGTFTVSASAPGAAGQAAFLLTVTPGPPSSIAATGGTPQTANISSAFPTVLTATVRDSAGNLIPGVVVTFSAPGSGPSGTFNGASSSQATTNASGVATSPTFTANTTAGSYGVTASAPGVGASTTFNLTNTQPTAFAIVATGGTPQSAPTGTAFPVPFSARVTDSNGTALANVVVTFTVVPNANGAGGTFTGGNTAITNSLGIATSSLLTANGIVGDYSVNASTAGLSPATFQLSNTGTTGGPQITIPSTLVGRNLQEPITISIPDPAPAGGRLITLTSSDPSRVLVSGRPGDPGVSVLLVSINEGLTAVGNIFIHGLADSGTATVTASSPGFTAGVATITLTPSAFVLSGPFGAAGSLQVNQGDLAALSVQAARLDSSGNFVKVQQVRGGLNVTVPISNAPGSVGTINPASVQIPGGESTGTVNFVASTSLLGVTTVTAEVPANFSQPSANANALVITVVPSGLVAPSITVGQNLQVTAAIGLNSPAPPSGLSVTITSTDPTRVLFSANANTVGSASITLNVPAGRRNSQDFFVQSLASSGTVGYFVTAPGFGSASGLVNLAPSGFVMNTPFGQGADFSTTSGAPNSDLAIFSAMLDGGLNVVAAQPVRGGLTVNVVVDSSNQTVGVITTSPLSIAGPNGSANTQFDPATNGNTTLRVVAPSGFATPSTGSAVVATVTTPNLILSSTTVGNGLQSIGTVLIGEAAPAGGLEVLINSGSPFVKLSLTETTAGSAQIRVTIPANQSAANFVIQAFANSGVASYSASAPGYQPASATVTLARSGVVISGPFGFGFPLVTTVSAGPQPISVSTAIVDSSNNFVSPQAVAGGTSVSVAVGKSPDPPVVGNVTPTIVIPGGSVEGVGQFTPLAVGQTTLSVTQPNGFSPPNTFTTLVARVN
jgi:hypothetical protein